VFVEEVILEAAAKHITTDNQLTGLEALQWGEIPKFVLIE
jgi:hypothetical protein